jgi:hypothetical protein
VIALAEPHLPNLAGVFPPLAFIAFVPDLVLIMLFSPSAFFAYLVSWRLRQVRVVQSRENLDGGLCFDAVALPVGAASLALVIALETLRFFWLSPPDPPSPLLPTISASLVAALRQLAGIAIIVGTFSSLKRLNSAFGKALGSAFFLLIAEIVISFASGWISIGRWPGSGSVRPLAQVLLYLAASSVLWVQSRAAWQGEATPGPNALPPAPPPPPRG